MNRIQDGQFGHDFGPLEDQCLAEYADYLGAIVNADQMHVVVLDLSVVVDEALQEPVQFIGDHKRVGGSARTVEDVRSRPPVDHNDQEIASARPSAVVADENLEDIVEKLSWYVSDEETVRYNKQLRLTRHWDLSVVRARRRNCEVCDLTTSVIEHHESRQIIGCQFVRKRLCR